MHIKLVTYMRNSENFNIGLKNVIKILAAFLFVFSTSGCASNEQKINKTLEVKDMRAIAELATVECYFHNVAKSDQPTGKVWYEFLSY